MHFILRHAATALNHPDERQSRIRAGGPDVPVSADGQAAIARLANFFKGKPIAKVHTSDTRRAGDTAKAIGEAAHAPVEEHAGLRPWDLGDLAGRKVGDVEHLLRQLYQSHHIKAPNGESFGEFYARYLPVVKGILQQSGNHVIVTHGRNVKTLWSLLKGKGRLHPGFSPHDPAPTQPGHVYMALPHDLVQVYAAGHGGQTKGVSS